MGRIVRETRGRVCVCVCEFGSLLHSTAQDLSIASAEEPISAVPLKMELSAAGDRVFAAEAILKRRVRKVSLFIKTHFISFYCGLQTQ